MPETQTLFCDYCKISFVRTKRRIKRTQKCGLKHNYCSSQCSGLAQSKNQTDVAQCDMCGILSKYPLSQIKRVRKYNEQRFYCSRLCRDKARRLNPRRKLKTIICIHCGATFSRPMAVASRARYCSYKCKNKAATGKKKQNNNVQKILYFLCEHCHKTFQRTKGKYNYGLKQKQKHIFCSQGCYHKARQGPRTSQPVICLWCGKTFLKQPARIRRHPKALCSRSCAQKWRYRNEPPKCYGRSKLEIYLETILRQEFPDLNLLCNDRKILGGLELDFYFPELRFAIELNGPVHYIILYNKESFERVQNHDKQKVLLCIEKGIELAVIDSSSCHRLTDQIKQKYWTIFKELLQIALKRV